MRMHRWCAMGLASALATFLVVDTAQAQQTTLNGQVRPRMESRDPSGGGSDTHTSMRTRLGLEAAGHDASRPLRIGFLRRARQRHQLAAGGGPHPAVAHELGEQLVGGELLAGELVDDLGDVAGPVERREDLVAQHGVLGEAAGETLQVQQGIEGRLAQLHRRRPQQVVEHHRVAEQPDGLDIRGRHTTSQHRVPAANIPHVAHHPAIQLDARNKNRLAAPVRLELDWFEVYAYRP